MKYSLLLLFMAFTIISCSNQEPTFFTPSENFIDSNVKFSQIDTISFKMSTFKLDSLATDSNGLIVVGQYNDPHFGIVKSAGFIDYGPKDYNLKDEAVFDSIVLNLPYSGYFYNDTLLLKKIKVEQLGKTIRLRNGQSRFYNTTNIPTSGLIGERSFYPRVKAKDSIKIQLNYAFGNSLFNKIRDGLIDNVEDLKLSFKGIKISADDLENTSIIGFKSDKSYIRFYYSLPDEPGEAKYYDFVFTGSQGVNKYFSQITSDRTNTVFPNFNNNEDEFFPTTSSPFTYINSGVGIVTKIFFPHFNESMANLNQSGKIYKANLKIPIKGNNYSKKLFTSDSVQVFVVNQNNDIIATLNNGSKQAVGYIRKVEPDINEKYLEVPIGEFLESTLSNPLYRKYGLIIVPFDYNASTNRMILNSQNNPVEKTKLRLTYLNYGN